MKQKKTVLGGLILDPLAWDDVSVLLTEEDFFVSSHRKIFATIAGMNKSNQHVDLITLGNKLKSQGFADSTFLAEIVSNTASSANISSYAGIIAEKSQLRKLIKTNDEISDLAYKEDYEDIGAFLDGVEQKIFNLSETRSSEQLTPVKELTSESIEKLEELSALQGQITGVPSGYEALDTMTAGFQPGELSIVAARPSMGKTAFSLNLALHATLKAKKSVAYFSVEMSKAAVMNRLLAISGRIPLYNLRVGSIKDNQWQKIITTGAQLSEAPLYINDSDVSPYEIRSQARRLKAKHGLDLVIVDYLQLIKLKQKVESREREVSEISHILKFIAKDLNIPVIALAQLNRTVEGRSNRRPMLSDLRESGSIEQDADLIMMLYRDDYYEKDNTDDKGVAEVIIGKQRNGPTGTVRLRWQPEYGVFANDLPESAPMPVGPPPGYNNGHHQKKDHSPKPTPAPPGGFKNFAPGADS